MLQCRAKKNIFFFMKKKLLSLEQIYCRNGRSTQKAATSVCLLVWVRVVLLKYTKAATKHNLWSKVGSSEYLFKLG